VSAGEPAADATEHAAQLARGENSSSALTRECLAVIEREDPLWQAFTHIDREGALAQAAAADERRARNQSLGRADGLPLALKANFAVRGWPHTGGYRYRRDARAGEDAPVVARLRAAGSVFLGLTNMDEGALGATSINPWYGTTRNPAAPDRSAGGSSGGSAAAVAARECLFALGTDTLGSVRIPAAWCGIVALKPTFGRIPLEGVIPVDARFDHVGLLGRSARDLALMLGLAAGKEPPTAGAVDGAPEPGSGSLGALRLGYALGLEDLDPAPVVMWGYERALEALRALGHRLLPIDVGSWKLAQARRAIFALSEVEMARRHADRLQGAPESFSSELQSMLAFGARQSPADLGRFEGRVAGLRTAAAAAMQGLDALVTPTVLKPAFRLDGPPASDSAELTAIASATGLPALSVPVRREDSLPVAVQLIGAAGSDFELIRLASELEAMLGARR
jgi:aspartyl-tRNA(Asn)/glutamyl-tRNA(Gln) amidotransferase subunit A